MGVSNVRTWNGSSDRMTVAMGSVGDSQFGSFLAIFKRNQTSHGMLLSGIQPAVQDFPQFYVANSANSNNISLYNGVTNTHASIPLVNADGWAIVGYAKATGTVAPRFHRCLLSSATWTHGASAANQANWSAAVTSGWHIGASDNTGAGGFTNWLGGDLYCVARWSGTALADATFETFTGINAIISAAPSNLWIFNQASVATAVTDTMGSGANETTLVGTTVSLNQTIPNFDTGSTPDVIGPPPMITSLAR